ncbi:hypothetical protein COO60DRAFT_152412 [Scenedesmus sp. NREL 46B-D3]|nr:hypothetical protein COO60DRAFT_152412 [Scenedesmus sp. NREL 46B-D3]
MDCPICLNHIELQNEAYLNPCFHRFCFTCIQQWTDAQKLHPPASPFRLESNNGSMALACPMCKRPYTHIVYDCVGRSYRMLATSGHTGGDADVALTAQQRRRRALYITQQQASSCDGQEQVAQPSRRGQPRAPNSPQITEWVTRELQALLLEDDVDVIVQHVLGVLQGLVNRQKQSRWKGLNTSPVYGPQTAFVDSIMQAIQGFLDEHAAAFAGQLWSFLQSGLSITAHDALLFGPEDAAPASSDADQAQEPEAAPSGAVAPEV